MALWSLYVGLLYLLEKPARVTIGFKEITFVLCRSVLTTAFLCCIGLFEQLKSNYLLVCVVFRCTFTWTVLSGWTEILQSKNAILCVPVVTSGYSIIPLHNFFRHPEFFSPDSVTTALSSVL